MSETVQATRALRLALDDLQQGTLAEILAQAQEYRPDLSEKVAKRTLARAVRARRVDLVAGIYVKHGEAPSARRPRKVPA